MFSGQLLDCGFRMDKLIATFAPVLNVKLVFKKERIQRSLESQSIVRTAENFYMARFGVHKSCFLVVGWPRIINPPRLAPG